MKISKPLNFGRELRVRVSSATLEALRAECAGRHTLSAYLREIINNRNAKPRATRREK